MLSVTDRLVLVSTVFSFPVHQALLGCTESEMNKSCLSPDLNYVRA